MSDSEILFTRATGCTFVTGLVAQRIRNIKTCQRKRVIPQQFPIFIRHLCLPNSSGNAIFFT